MTMTITVNTAQLREYLDQLGDKVDEAVRPAAQAGAQVLYDEVQKNVARIGKKTGNLSSSIYQVFSKKDSPEGLATYYVSWNAQKAPHGHLVEYGHIQKYQSVLNKKTGKWITLKNRPLKQSKQVMAQPFIRPAQAKFPQALEAMKAELFKQIEEKF